MQFLGGAGELDAGFLLSARHVYGPGGVAKEPLALAHDAGNREECELPFGVSSHRSMALIRPRPAAYRTRDMFISISATSGSSLVLASAAAGMFMSAMLCPPTVGADRYRLQNGQRRSVYPVFPHPYLSVLRGIRRAAAGRRIGRLSAVVDLADDPVAVGPDPRCPRARVAEDAVGGQLGHGAFQVSRASRPHAGHAWGPRLRLLGGHTAPDRRRPTGKPGAARCPVVRDWGVTPVRARRKSGCVSHCRNGTSPRRRTEP